jgi:Tol biopolymer transport system component
VVFRGATLQRVGVDGNAVPEGIEIAGFYAVQPTSAASRNRLAFVRSGNQGDIYRFEPGRPPEAVAVSSFLDWVPQLSPDGRRLAWASQRAGGGDEIWMASADGSNPTRLTHGPGLWQSSPRWSPDGRRIAFDSFGEDGQWDAWTIDADGGPPRRLTSDPTDELLPSWSHDGTFVYFSSMRTGTWTIWRIPSSGGAEEPVTQAGGGRSQEAPDGRTLYLQRNVRGDSPLLAVPLAGGAERTVVDCVRRYSFALTAAGIYFVGCGGDAPGAPLVLLDPATGLRRQLGTLERPGQGLTVSADGKTILYTKRVGEGSDLVLIENFR